MPLNRIIDLAEADCGIPPDEAQALATRRKKAASLLARYKDRDKLKPPGPDPVLGAERSSAESEWYRAIHEAAHAFACYRVGIGLEFVSLNEQKCMPCSGLYTDLEAAEANFRTDPAGSRRLFAKYLIAALSGTTIEAFIRGGSFAPPILGTDLEEAERCLRYFSNMRGVDFQAYLWDEMTIPGNLDAILVLATELISKRRLDGAVAEDIIAKSLAEPIPMERKWWEFWK